MKYLPRKLPIFNAWLPNNTLLFILHFPLCHPRLTENGYGFLTQTVCTFTYLQGAKITKASHFDYEYVLGHKVGTRASILGFYREGVKRLFSGP